MTGCVIARAVKDLSRRDWEQALQQGGEDVREGISKLLKVRLRQGQRDSRLLVVKAAQLDDRRAHALASLLSAPATQVAVQLLGDRAPAPSVEDLRRVWREWIRTTSEGLATLALLVVIDQAQPAAASAQTFLEEELGHMPLSHNDAPSDGALEPRPLSDDDHGGSEPVGDRAGDAIDGLRSLEQELLEARAIFREALSGLLIAVDADEVPPSGLLASLSGAVLDMTRLAEQAELLCQNVPVTFDVSVGLSAAIRAAADEARATAEAQERAQEEAKQREDMQARACEAAKALAPLAQVHGPNEYESDISRLRAKAGVPDDPADISRWLSHSAALVELLKHLSGEQALTDSRYGAVAEASSPVILGLALSRALSLDEAKDVAFRGEPSARPPDLAPHDICAEAASAAGPSRREMAGSHTDMNPPPTSRQRGHGTTGQPRRKPGAQAGKEQTFSDSGPASGLPTKSAAVVPVVDSQGEAAPEGAAVPAVTQTAYAPTDIAAERITGERMQRRGEEPDFKSIESQGHRGRSAEGAAPGADLAGVAEAPVDPSQERAAWDALGRLVGDRHLDAAAWAARCLDRQLGSALEALAMAIAIRNDSGPLAESLWAKAPEYSEIREGDQAQVLAAALVLAAPVSPFTGATDLLETLAPCLGEGPLRELSGAVISAARQGFVLSPSPGAMEDNDSLAASVDVYIEAAREQLARVTARKLKHPRATRVLHEWMGEEGMLGWMLAIVRDDRQDRVSVVRRAAVKLQDDRELERAVDLTDERLRPPSETSKLVAHARQRLIEHARESLQIVDGWCRAVGRRESEHDAAGATVAAELREATASASEALIADTANVGSRRVVSLAVEMAIDQLMSWLTDGLPPDPEPTIDELLDGWLPYVFEARLTRASWQEVPPEALPGLLEAPQRTAQQAYDGFESRLDHAGTARLIDAVAQVAPEVAQRLRRRRDHDEPAARAALLRRLERVQAEFDELEAYPGALSNEQAVVVRGHLLDAADLAEEDLGSAARRTEEADCILELTRSTQLSALRAALAQSTLDSEDVTAVSHLLSQGALSAAHERLDAARVNGTRSSRDRDDFLELQRRFWSQMIAAAEQDAAPQKAIAALRGVAPLDPFGAGPDEGSLRSTQAAGLDAWIRLFSEKQTGDFEGRLRAVLNLMALQAPVARRARDSRMRGTHLALDVEGARPVLPVVDHEFGSSAAGRYRILLIWESMPVDRLVSLVVSDTAQGPHLVLYRGVLSQAARLTLAVAARADEAAPRRILVIDDAVALAMAMHPRPTFAVLEHLALPFARATIFTPDVAGNVPPELFRGRRRELDEVINPNGSSFVYGGRQVGKSALLRAAAREVEAAGDSDRRAVYLDVKGLGLGLWRDADELWLEILEELRRRDVVTERTSRTARGDAAVSHIRTWLDAVPGRRLLLLLDECDDLLDADAKRNFQIVERLRALMNVTNRRFKVVLAGLHRVQRFERERNVPLEHLAQQPVNVGPLQPADAVDLLQAPLLALGYVLDETATWRLLSHTNYQAGLIQVFGQALLAALQRRPASVTEIPTIVDRSFVDRVFAEEGLADQMRRRFMLTINLDDRYRCIAYVIALRNLELGMEADYEEAELRDTCSYWWPVGLDGMPAAVFHGLVEEMVGLGVLVRLGTGLRIRNPNVVRLLGNRRHIEAELIDFEALEAPKGFEATLYRRALPDGGRSPLTEEELASVVEADSPGLVLVGGSVALGVDRVVSAIEDKLADRPEVSFFENVAPFELADRLTAASSRTVMIADARGLSVSDAEEVALKVQSAVDDMPRNTAMRRGVLLLGPEHYRLWFDGVAPPRGLSGSQRLGLRRVTSSSLQAWSGEEQLHLDRASCDALMAGTGGWPVLLDLALKRRAKGSQDWAASAEGARNFALADTKFVEAALGGHAASKAVAQLLIELDEPVTWPFLVELADGAFDEAARDVIAALQLTVDRGDGRFELEPLLAAAARAT